VTDLRRLRPVETCRLLNSTPLGEVLTPDRLSGHRTRAGLRIGDGKHVDLIRYVAWLVYRRHVPAEPNTSPAAASHTAEAARGAVAAVCRPAPRGHGQKFTARHEALAAALLTEPTYARAAAKVGVSEKTLYRWLREPAFKDVYRDACRELVEASVGRVQAASGDAVDALVAVARTGRRDGDRVRASTVLLDHAYRGLADADLLHGGSESTQPGPATTAEVVTMLAARLQQVERSRLPTAEKARLTASLADALLRAVGVDVIDRRLEALHAVVLGRKEARP
jgi:hypothetical protein